MPYRLLTAACAVMMTLLPALAQSVITAREAFTAAPSAVLDLLSRNDRLDMLDYYDSGHDTPVPNDLGGYASVTSITDRTLTIDLGPAAQWDLVVIPGDVPENDMLAVVTTVSLPARDSNVRFYNTNTWLEVPAESVLPTLRLDDWLTKQGRTNRREFETTVPFIPAYYTFDPASSTLTVTHDLATLLNPDDYASVAPYVAPAIVYRWDGKKMKLAK